MEKTEKRMKMEEEIRKVIPEIEFIKDTELQQKVVDVWCDAMEIGGWKVEDLDKIPFTLLLDPCPASFLTHTRSVTTCAYMMGKTLENFYDEKNLKINMDYLVAGAILHDVGKLIEYKRENGKYKKSNEGRLLRHPYSGVAVAYKRGIPFEILHMIAMHAKEGNLGKRIPEAVIIHHADFTNFEPFH